MRMIQGRHRTRTCYPLLLVIVIGALVLLGASAAFGLPAARVITMAGTAGPGGNANGTGPAASFSDPSGVAVDSAGNVFVADTFNNLIRKVTPLGVVTTFAGSGSIGSTNGVGPAASFNSPVGVAVDATGNVYVADTGNNTIRKITSGGSVSTLAGTAGSFGATNAVGPAASFDTPSALAVDGSGNVYVADTANSTIRKITPGGSVSTLAGSAGVDGSGDGLGGAATFFAPQGIASDSAGNLFVADTGNSTMRAIDPAGNVSTFAGTAGTFASQDGQGVAAFFNSPEGVGLDGSGNVWVADTGNNTIRVLDAGANSSTLVGNVGVAGSADGVGSAATFNSPWSVTVDSSGIAYVADSLNNTIRKIAPAGASYTLTPSAGLHGTIAPSTVQTVTAGANSTFTVTPDPSYHVASVLVDGGSVGAPTSYGFFGVTANHTISASFAINTFTIVGTAGAGGTISPSGTQTVNAGSNTTFTVTPNAGFHIVDVLVDLASQGATSSFTFTNVQANHTISAVFGQDNFTIVPTSGANGTISPATTVTVAPGANTTFTMTPNAGFHIGTVLVDGSPVAASSPFVFTNVQANHTIAVTFAINTFTIVPSAGANGSISPATTTTVNAGSNATFTITPNAGFGIATITVDGAPAGSTSPFVFTNVQANHTISATFRDTGAPTTISDASVSYLNTATIHLSATDNVGGSGVAHTFFRLDGAVQTEGLTVVSSTFGVHNLEFWSVDVAGNVETPHKFVTFNIDDTIAPTTTSDAVLSYVTTATVHLSASDNVGGSGVAHTFYRLDGGAQTEGTTIVATGLGNHGLEFWSVDVATNIELPHHIISFAITAFDTTAPVTTSDAVASYVGTATVHLNATDVGGSGVAHTFYRLDSGAQTEATTIVVTALGSHSLEFWSQDVVGNVELPHHTVTFVVTAPVSATTINIHSTATSVARGRTFVLSGQVTPQLLLGTNIQVMVKKPNKAYYSYSSLRTVYSNAGVASWFYRYNAITTLVPGVYRFFAFVPASASFLRSQSSILAVTIR